MTDATLTDDDAIYCGCGAALSDAEIDESGCECTRCHAASHFTCGDCGESIDNEERSGKCKTRCQTCQETKDEAELEEQTDALRDQARDLVEAICDDRDMATLRKTVAALRKLSK